MTSSSTLRDPSPVTAPDRAPGKLLLGTDFLRGLADLGSMSVTWPVLLSAPRGDGQPVLVIPGLGTGDVSTMALRNYLTVLGYDAYGWGLGVNVGPTAKIAQGAPTKLRAIHDKHGRPVTVIGWSLGGLIARRLAREMPEMVRQVITLGSPIRIRTHDHSHGRRLYAMFGKRHVEQFDMPLEEGLPPLPMPTTSIYSRLDGIVSWHACLDVVTQRSENIEVHAAHLGLGYQAAALYAVADRLAQPEGGWTPFVPPRWARAAYPRPTERIAPTPD
ncbi:alpha/beta hydrolase [Rhodococcus sp. KRD162]|uniref:esterase/lipase family protein n=1 Tax=Rhodococcus sp. KRD162 TaxID=2729725 RepID=UPI001F4A097C|nr:alpha/beta hydrolase [Rhodococcus sp. KRD162]